MLYKNYITEIHHNLGYIATWLPSVQMELGDVVTFGDAGFQRVAGLKDFGIKFKTRSDTNLSTYDYSSAGAVAIVANVGAQARIPGSKGGKPQAKVTVQFNRANAVVYHAVGCQASAIADQDGLGREITFRYENDKWPKERFVVTELIKARSATIVISGTAGAKLDLVAKGAIQASSINLADVRAKLEIASSTNIGLQIVAQSDLTPMFRASGMRLRFLRSAKFGNRGKSLTDKPTARERLAYEFVTPTMLFKE